MSLVFLLTITVHAQTDGDSIGTQTPDVVPPSVQVITPPTGCVVLSAYMQYFLKVHDAFADTPSMVKIACAESSFNPTNKNPYSSAKGLFQILDGTWKGNQCTGNVYNADDNIACAQKIYASDGTSDWNASKSTWSKMK